MHYAAWCKKKHLVQRLVKCGADVSAIDKDRRTPLHCISMNSITQPHGSGICEAIVELLIEAGANVSAVDKDGKTPLHIAIQNGFQRLDRYDNHQSIVQVFIKAGADVNIPDADGNTPLHYLLQNINKARHEGYNYQPFENFLWLFVEAGVTISVVDEDRWSLLHYVAWSKNRKLLEQLIKHSADVSIVNSDGETPLHKVLQNVKESQFYRGSQGDPHGTVSQESIDSNALLINFWWPTDKCDST